MGASKTSDHIQIKIKIPNPSQEPPASSKPPNEDLKDMDVICTFKIKIESHNLAYGVPKTSDHIQINITMPNPSQEPPASSKAPYQVFFEPSKSSERAKIQNMGISKTVTMSKPRSKCQTPVRSLQHSPNLQIRT